MTKIKEYLKKLLEALKNAFKRGVAMGAATTCPPVPVEPVEPPTEPVYVVNGLDLRTVNGWTQAQVEIRVGRPLTPEETAIALEAGMIPYGEVTPPAPVDPTVPNVPISGFVLSATGQMVTNFLTQGVSYIYTFPGPGANYRVVPVSGDEIHTVNGAPYDSGFIPIPESRSVTLVVTGVGRNPPVLYVGVQLTS
jgi:hypothetical protein